MIPLLGATWLLAGQAWPPTLDPTYTRSLPAQPRAEIAKVPAEKWIWAAETRDKQVVHLRRRFQAGSRPRRADLYITADNYFSASIDGQSVGETAVGIDSEGEGWRTIHHYDVARLLGPGSHEIDVKATNAGGPAGLLARLDLDGRRAWWTDQDWQVSDAPGGPWVTAHEEDPVGAGPWGGDLKDWPDDINAVPGYLKHKPIRPVAFSRVVSDPDALTWLSEAVPGDSNVILDFGKELTGRIVVRAKRPCELLIAPGESAGEAMEKPYVSASVRLEPGQTGTSPWSAQRYARLTFKSGNIADVSVSLDHLYYPVAYQGSFDCSDPLLTKLWYTGAYTAHLCMQQDIWDAPKRDRARWMGDLHVSGETIDNAFLDRFLMEQTMDRLRDDAWGGQPFSELPKQHVNGIPGYSCAWIAGLADFYRHTGDLDYIRAQREAIHSMLRYLRSELGADQVFVNKHGEWPFVDWSPDFDKDTPQARAATHLFFAYAAKEAEFLLRALGENGGEAAALWQDLSSAGRKSLVDVDGTYGGRRQKNAMAVYSGVAEPAQFSAIWDRVFRAESPAWNEVATPYYNNYVIFAMSEMGHTPEAMKFVRRYWGGMVNEGATSFWEGFDPSWDTHDFHSHLQADDGTGFFVSLSHGWSSGVTSWLTERVLGVRPLTGGFGTVEIAPDLGDLDWASGDVPTPHGPIHVRFERDGRKTTVHLELPKDVKAEVRVGSRRRTIEASPKPVRATFSVEPMP